MKKRCQYIEKCCFFILIRIIKNKYFMVFRIFSLMHWVFMTFFYFKTNFYCAYTL